MLDLGCENARARLGSLNETIKGTRGNDELTTGTSHLRALGQGLDGRPSPQRIQIRRIWGDARIRAI